MTAAWLHGAVVQFPDRVDVVLAEPGTFHRQSWERYLHSQVRPKAENRPAAVLPESFSLPVTTVELTIVDLVSDYRVPDVEAALIALADRGSDPAEVARLLSVRRRADTIARRLGFMLEDAGYDAEPLRSVLNPRRNPVSMDAAGRRIGEIDERCRVRVNGK